MNIITAVMNHYQHLMLNEHNYSGLTMRDQIYDKTII